MECTSPSERVKLAGANLHETTYADLNNLYIAKAKDFADRLKPMTGRIWTVLTGHHMANLQLTKGSNSIASDEYIAQLLGATYAGDGMATIYVNVNGVEFKIMSDHGYGSARTKSAQMSKRMKMREVILDANWYAMGHDNVKAAVEEEPFILTPDGPKAFKQYFSGIGSLQESYEVGNPIASYAERFLMTPSALGFVRMTIEPQRTNGKTRLDYHIRL